MRDLGRRLFTFAVVSDSHVNEEEDRSASPYACNRLANGRFRWVVHDLNRRAPAFVVHLGDMGNPLPELASYRPAAERFAAIAGELRAPLHLVAGNHCLGDKPGGWVPVPRVSVESLRQYEGIHGRATYSFDHGPCHFVVLSSLLINSGLAAEADQKRWLERDLADAGDAGRRIWVMMHYPAYIGAPDEHGSYDNVDEPGRSWLLHLFEEHDVEAVYSGHVHNYFYNRYAGTDLYTAPATSFVRHDYAELFKVAPGDEEGGRNDPAKLGYCLVEVYDRGHVNRVVRTGGRMLAAGAAPPAGVAREGCSGAGARKRRLGIEMRENWLARTHLRTNNSVSPFTRRCARNDWAVLALQEMGVARVRVALQELVRDDVVERMATLEEVGFEFTVYSHGMPRDSEYRLIREHRALLAGWELIMRPDQIRAVARRIAGVGLPCYLNEIRDVRQARLDDANVKHEAIYGFQSTDREQLEQLVGRAEVLESFRGLVFRVRRRGHTAISPWRSILEIGELGRCWGMNHQAHILFSGNLTAERLEDDLATANRVAESALASWAAGGVDVVFDTFEDVDRGYYVRHGLVDRRYNPRLAARVLRHLHASLARHDPGEACEAEAHAPDGGRVLSVRFAAGLLALVLPGEGFTLRRIDGTGGARSVRLIDLGDGAVSEVGVTDSGSGLRLAEPVAVARPALVEAHPAG